MSPLEKASPESVKAARAQMLRERYDVMRETGVVIRPDGTIVMPSLAMPKTPTRWYCETCDRWFACGRECKECGARLQRAARSH